ncbi:MAG: Gfo/Idh/MocA family oxidoreductase [Ruminococcaceae bacterium]|nr:Gfo/Idh/MocA family oxidoreductase [Oscillospiraceae bacterium]
MKQKELINDDSVSYYTDFDSFIQHDMDAVVLANFANEHAPFAIKAMKAGKHVFSEVLPAQNLKEAIELIETVEETGKIYAYGENYCYMSAPYEMKKLYQAGKIGEFEYGEGEYIHNCESEWYALTYGDPNHWRNNAYATFYCTHSLGPIVHITGLRPVSVTGFESLKNNRFKNMGKKAGLFGIEMVTFENGGIYKSIHGGLYKNSIWYSVYGSKGRMESAREDAENDGVWRIFVNADENEGDYAKDTLTTYKPSQGKEDKIEGFGHGGSDFYSMYNFAEKILGNPDADIIDVYEAMDMFLPGLFAYRSVLKGGIPMEIPNFRNKEERDPYRNDTACTDPKAAGDMLLPVMSTGNPDIPDEIYETMKQKWEEEKFKKGGRAANLFYQMKKDEKEGK